MERNKGNDGNAGNQDGNDENAGNQDGNAGNRGGDHFSDQFLINDIVNFESFSCIGFTCLNT